MVPNDGYLKGVRYNVVFRVLYVQLTSALIPSFPYLLSLTFMSVTPATLSAFTGHLRRAVLILGSCAQSTMSFGLQMR